MEITDAMIGKEITCKIHTDIISDGKIQKEGPTYYICQNERLGSSCTNKLGYKHSWSVLLGSELEQGNHNVSELKLKSTELPIFN